MKCELFCQNEADMKIANNFGLYLEVIAVCNSCYKFANFFQKPNRKLASFPIEYSNEKIKELIIFI